MIKFIKDNKVCKVLLNAAIILSAIIEAVFLMFIVFNKSNVNESDLNKIQDIRQAFEQINKNGRVLNQNHTNPKAIIVKPQTEK